MGQMSLLGPSWQQKLDRLSQQFGPAVAEELLGLSVAPD